MKGMEANEKQVEYYETADGKSPFREWFVALRDRKAQARIDARLARVRLVILASTSQWVEV